MSLRQDVHSMMVQMDEDSIPQGSRRIKVKDLAEFSKAFISEQDDPYRVSPGGVVTHVYGVPVEEDATLGHQLVMVLIDPGAD